MNRLVRIIFFILLFIFLFNCSTVDNEEAPIVIEDIKILKTESRTPRVGDYQCDLELRAAMSEDNRSQDIDYKWIVEDLKTDIISNDYESDRTSDLLISNYKKDFYFIDVSNNPLVSMLSIYSPGYYKLTLIASNINETKSKSVIIKVGKPEKKNLYFKFNIPEQSVVEGDKTDLFKGKFYCSFYNQKERPKLLEDSIIDINASKLASGWSDTGIKVDPFDSFGIDTGSFVIKDGKEYSLGSISKTVFGDTGEIKYDFKETKGRAVRTSPLILSKLASGEIFSIYKDKFTKWDRGALYVDFLIWGYDEDGNDAFNFVEKNINEANEVVTSYFDNKYLVKIFIGSVSQKVFSNDYYISFGPEGSDIEELDVKKKRDFTGLPYGYLLGRIGVDGAVFPVGISYYYSPSLIENIYYVDYQPVNPNNIVSNNDEILEKNDLKEGVENSVVDNSVKDENKSKEETGNVDEKKSEEDTADNSLTDSASDLEETSLENKEVSIEKDSSNIENNDSSVYEVIEDDLSTDN